jgi:hypothetical protein
MSLQTVPPGQHNQKAKKMSPDMRRFFHIISSVWTGHMPGQLVVQFTDHCTYPCGYRGNENLGKFWAIDPKRFDAKKSCRLCDWECFRDPSELFGPLLQRSSPFGLLHKIIKEPEYFAVWWKDLSYYRACDLFDGRRPPKYWKLVKFASKVDQRGKSRFSWKQDLS